MAQKTDLNVAPYYDDFDTTDNFHRVLFRPGFAVQARELTQLQSILQNQIERHGQHVFKDGTVIIPGQISVSDAYTSIQLASTFGGEDVVVAQYLNTTTPVIITGATSGVKATVIGVEAGTSTTQPRLYIQYTESGTDNETTTFSNSENIIADASVTHTTTYATNVASATTHTTAAQTGTSAKIENGIYYVRGQFVRVAEQTHVIDATTNSATARVGLTITETLVTPESDSTLTDNATGSPNYAAKGAHRLKISLSLSSLAEGSTADSSFIEVVRVKNGNVDFNARFTDYSILGDTLARRTFDESGDYTTRPFQFDMRESITNTLRNKTFNGVYASGVTTDDGNTASDSLLALAVTPGKAYVKGYEIEKVSNTFIDVNKARDFATVNAGVTTFEVGNFTKITNLYSTPDIGSVSGETTAYNTLSLFDKETITRGSASGNQVGVARARTIQHDSGTAGNTDAVYKLFLFDIRPFTYLTLNDIPSPTLIASRTNGGVKITGNTSGATGFVFGSLTSGTQIVLTQVIGTFSSGEKIIASDSAETGLIIENAANADLTVSDIVTHSFADARQIFMDDSDSGQDFTADLVLETTAGLSGKVVLNGTDANSNNANDDVQLEDATGNIAREDIKTATLTSPEKNVSIFKLPKQVVKTLLTTVNNNASDSQITVRRQFVGTTTTGGVVSFTAGSNETFVGFVEKDYTMSILTAGDGSGAQGDIVSVSGNTSGTGTATLTVTDNTILGSGAKVKFIGTILKTSVASKVKTTQLCKQLKVDVGATHAFGTRPTDDIISLGRADAFKVVGVFDSEDTSSDATTPELTIGTITGTFTRGEQITGSSSGAVARIIDTVSPMSYVLTNGFGATNFTASDTITGTSSGATATVSAVTAGSKVITSNFTLDTGQRDNFYDIARLVRKKTATAPRGRLLVVYDFFAHSAGEFFSVDSYSNVGGQMDYDNIPTYTATRVDPDDPEPSGEFPLADCIDFRPTCENITGASSTLAAIDEITGESFDFFQRQFDGTGAVVVDSPQPDSFIQADFEFFLSKRASLFLTPDGDFRLVEGQSAEEPVEPKDLDNTMKLATLSIPAYTFTPEDVTIERLKTQRFTMRDIGRLQDRIENLEFSTALSLLERDAESFEIQDANGLNRFKSGFVVDNFAGHRLGNTVNKDYKCAIDMVDKELRPKCVLRNTALSEVNTTDATRLSAGYQKTGDLLTLPYTSTTLTQNTYATKVENVQPYLVASFAGQINLTPSGDEWFETETAPDVIINVEGNFNSVLSANRNAIGTVWNAWETTWSGSTTRTVRTGGFTMGPKGSSSAGRVIGTTTDTRTNQARTGLKTTVVENVTEESLGTKVINRSLIPFVRPRNISFSGFGFKPKTRVYIFFDGQDVNKFVTPLSTTYTTQGASSVSVGSALVTSAAGKIEGTFAIPDYKFPGQESNPKFKTGEVAFRVTSSASNDRSVAPKTFADAIYFAKGTLEVEQETIVATRNGILTQENVSDNRTLTSSTFRPRPVPQFRGGACFVAGTPMTMSDGSIKKIEDVKIGDKLKGNGDNVNTVDKYQPKKTAGRRLISINGSEFFTTEDHPFWTTEGWKSANKTMSNKSWYGHLNCGILEVGDFIYSENDEKIEVKSLDFKEVDPDIDLYNFEMSGNSTYIAHNFVMHNKGGDPLAQTFIVNEEGGCFATKIDLYFQEKPSDLPVRVEIREVVNGYPGPRILPFGRKVLEPSEVNLSDDATTATTFTFDSPVFLDEGKEYCFVTLTDSLFYKVWISEMGQLDVGGSRLVSEQPHLGVLFKSQNNRTWSAVQAEDMKFTLYRAEFSPTTGQISMTNDNIGDETTAEDGSTEVYGRRLQSNPLTLETTSTVVKVKHPDHGMYSTSNNVTITGAKSGIETTLDGAITATATSLTLTSGTGFVASNLSSRCYVKIGNEIMFGTISGTALSSITRGIDGTTAAAHADDVTVEFYQILGTPLDQINKTHTALANIEMDSYTISLTTAPTITGATTSAEVGDVSIFATENYRMELMKGLVSTLELPNTTVTSSIKTTSGTSPAGSESSFSTDTSSTVIPLNENFRFTSSRLIASSINETNELGGAKSFFLDIVLDTNKSNLSPVVDLERASIVSVGNRLDNVDSSSDVYPTTEYNASTEPDGDQNSFIYITKKVAIENPATALKVFFAGHRHSSSEIKVLFKILRSDSADDFEEIGYEFFNTTGTTDVTTPSSLDDGDFQQYLYTAGVTDDGIGEPLPEFIAFAIKIVGQGTNAAEPIRIRDLRVIALAT